MKALLIAALALTSFAASAKTTRINCSFTEPFFSMDLNLAKQTILISAPFGSILNDRVETDRTDRVNHLDITFNDGVYTVKAPTVDEKQITLLTIDTKKKGSDGMSDRVYAAEGVATFPTADSKNVGGCSLN